MYLVTICLQVDNKESGALVITPHDSEKLGVNGNIFIKVIMKEGDIVSHGRFFHHKPSCHRESDRCTLNFFFKIINDSNIIVILIYLIIFFLN